MADRELTVRTNLEAGRDTLSESLERQRRTVLQLQGQMTRLREEAQRPVSPAAAGGTPARRATILDAPARQAAEPQLPVVGGTRLGVDSQRPPGRITVLRREIAEREAAGAEPGSPMARGLERRRQELAPLEVEAEMRRRAASISARLQGQSYSPAVPQAQPGELRQQARMEAQVRREQAEREEADRQRRLRNRAVVAVTGRIPESEINVVGGSEGGGGGLLSGALRQRLAGSILSGISGGGLVKGSRGENALGGLSQMGGMFAALPGPIGAVATGFTLLTGVGAALVDSFRGVRQSAETLIDEFNRQQSGLGRGRRTGMTSAQDLQAALTPEEYRQLTQAQQGGDAAGVRRVLSAARERATTAQAGAGGAVGAQGTLAEQLSNINRDVSREPGGLFGFMSGTGRRLGNVFGQNGTFAAQRTAALRAAGISEDQIPAMDNELMTPQRIRELSRLAGGNSVQAQNALQAIENVRRSGFLPDLRPGGIQMADLPSMFRSQQVGTTDVHSQVQQEVVRDQRQEQQFQAQMNMWQRFLDNQQAQITLMQGGPGAPPGAPAPPWPFPAGGAS